MNFLKFNTTSQKNVNENPVAERAILEIEDEILKIQTEDKQTTQAVLAQATMAVNNAIRYMGYTGYELFTNTNNFTGQNLNIQEGMKCLHFQK